MHAKVMAAALASAVATIPLWGAATPACRVLSTGLAFGATDTLRTREHVAVGLLSVICEGPGEALITIGLQRGDQSSWHRGFEGHPGAPTFSLYVDPAHRAPWGDGTSGTATIQRRVRGDGRILQLPIYGELRVRGTISPDRYAITLPLIVEVHGVEVP